MLGFVFGNDWNVSAEHFGALPLLVGTLITSALALLIGVPVAVATARLRDRAVPAAPARAADGAGRAAGRRALGRVRPVGHLLPRPEAAAAPSSGWPTGCRSSRSSAAALVTIPNYFIAGLVLAIMILPIVSAISREVMATVPADHKEAALGARRHALGDDPHRRAALLPLGHRRRGDARPRPRDRRDDRRDDPDRRRARSWATTCSARATASPR